MHHGNTDKKLENKKLENKMIKNDLLQYGVKR